MVTAWESWEVLEETIRRDSLAVALALGQSQSIVQKWKEAPRTEDDPTYSGHRNPLDRLEIIIRTIERIDKKRAHLLIHWLNQRFGYMPPVPMPNGYDAPEDVLQAVLSWHKEFGETCQQISFTLADGKVTRQEYRDCMRAAFDDIQALLGLLSKLEMQIK